MLQSDFMGHLARKGALRDAQVVDSNLNRSRRDGLSDVLIDEDRVSVGVQRDKTGGTRGALIGLVHQLHALGLQLALEFAHVGKRGELLGALVPAGVEGQDVALEHPLEQPDHVAAAVFQDQPVPGGVPGEARKSQFLVEAP